MKILFVCHRVPFPPNKGDKIRAFNIIKFLSEKHEIYLCSSYDERIDIQARNALRKLCKEVHIFYLNPFLSKLKAILSFLRNKPMSVGYFNSRGLKTKVEEILRKEKIDLVFAYSSPSAQYCIGKKIRKIMDFVDCDSGKWEQYGRILPPPLSYLYRREHKQLRRYEKKIIEEFDSCIVITELERNEFAKFSDTRKMQVILNGVDAGYFKPNYSNNPSRIIFTGAMDYYANVDSVVYFANRIFPRIKKDFPEVEFYIVGPRPVSEIRKLAGLDGVFIKGFVNDIRSVYDNASIAVVPSFRIAQGLQNKILEAMACGLAVVTTTKAVSCLKVKSGIEVLIADDDSDFAEKVVRLLKDKSLCLDIGKRARIYVEQYHNWQKNLSKLDNLF